MFKAVKELQKSDLANNEWKVYNGSYTLILANHSQDEMFSPAFKLVSLPDTINYILLLFNKLQLPPNV